jgi:hypothetical protein
MDTESFSFDPSASSGTVPGATPLPWRYSRANPSPTTGEHLISGGKPGYLAEMRDCGSGDPAANARRIVQCVNSHDALVAALRDLAGWMDMAEDMPADKAAMYAADLARARAALAAATKEQA